jgi:hypothetical protein
MDGLENWMSKLESIEGDRSLLPFERESSFDGRASRCSNDISCHAAA